MGDLEKDNFKFEGFCPSNPFRSVCKDFYSRVESNSPSQSAKLAYIEKSENGEYTGVIQVVSSSGTFKVQSAHSNPQSMLDDLYTQFLSEIHHWHQDREQVPRL